MTTELDSTENFTAQKIVIATFGSLGDMHPMNALGIELKKRGHHLTFAAGEFYREKIEMLGFNFAPMRPNLNPEDKQLARRLMDTKKGSENLLREIIIPNLRPMYEDLQKAISDADILISGEAVFVAKSLAQKTHIKWITTTLAPGTLLSVYDPFVPPSAQWLKHLRFLGARFHTEVYKAARKVIDSWLEPYRAFRRELGLNENHNPMFEGKSDLLNLAMFSHVLGAPQNDWHQPTVQTGFCFYDGKDDFGKISEKLDEFLEKGDAPIVFTLGSAAVLDARDFFDESVKAAKTLNKRAVCLYGVFNEPPKGLDDSIVGFDYAPYSQIFPKAACVVHQGGVGTTSQVLRAGVPHLIMPYSHDQPDNAERCKRLGVAETISREKYSAETAAKLLRRILTDSKYQTNAAEAAQIIQAENGTQTACDAIENVSGKRNPA